MIHNLIFDLDGTLVDSCAICVGILGGMLQDRGSERVIDPVGAKAYMSRGGVHMVSGLLGDDCGDPEQELTEFRARYARITTPHDALFPGVAEGLAHLHKAGFTLSICSNKPQNLCEQVLADTALDRLFTTIVGGTPGLRAKPAPDLLEATLGRIDARPETCLFIGDSELDHQIAETAGIPFLFMTYGYAIEGWQPGACEQFDCFTEMSRTVSARAAPSRAA